MSATVEVRKLHIGAHRFWSAEKTGTCQIRYADGGWVGGYVCGRCRKPANGVYALAGGIHICGTCKDGQQRLSKAPVGTAVEARERQNSASMQLG